MWHDRVASSCAHLDSVYKLVAYNHDLSVHKVCGQTDPIVPERHRIVFSRLTRGLSLVGGHVCPEDRVCVTLRVFG